MKAIVCKEYGDSEGLQLKEVEKPIPKKNEVLIKIYATTLTSGDLHIRQADPWGVRLFYGLIKPKKNTILGTELAGEIEAVGENVKLFQVGDRIFAGSGMSLGANAEYICLPETGAIALKPNN